MGKLIVSTDIPESMKAEVIVEEVLGLARPRYTLRQLCRVIDFGDAIQGKIPIATTLAGQEKVPPLVEAELSAQSYVDLNFELWKNVVHVAISKEAELKSKFDIMQLKVQDAARDLARMENKQIGAELDTLTAIAGSDWSVDTNDPLEDIMAAIEAIESLGYEPKVIAMATGVYAAFVHNDKVKEAYERGATVARGKIPAVAGLRIVVDTHITPKTAIVLDPDAPCIALADGPQLVEKYPGGAKFFDGYAIAQFLQPKIALDDAGRKLTGLLP